MHKEEKKTVKLYKQKMSCFCIPSYEEALQQDYPENYVDTNSENFKNNFIKKGEATFNDLSEDAKGKYVEKNKITFENLQEDEREKYIKKGDVKINDLSEEDKQQLTEDAVLQSKIDGSEITWKDFLQEANTNIDIIKRKYLQKQKNLITSGNTTMGNHN